MAVYPGVCDFCSTPGPPWEYETEHNIRHEMVGGYSLTIHDEPGYAACDVCADFIDREEWVALALRSLQGFEAQHGEFTSPEKKEQALTAISLVQETFRQYKRSGRKPVKVG